MDRLLKQFQEAVIVGDYDTVKSILANQTGTTGAMLVMESLFRDDSVVTKDDLLSLFDEYAA